MLWTAENDAALLEAAAKGLSCSDIAERVFGGTRTRNAIIGRLHRLVHKKGDIAPTRRRGPKPAPRVRPPAAPTLEQVAPAVAQLACNPIQVDATQRPITAKPKAPPSRAPAQEPAEPVEPVPMNLDITDVKSGMCRFSTASVGRTHLFCGAPTQGTDHVWCGWHRRIVYAGQTAAQALRRYR